MKRNKNSMNSFGRAPSSQMSDARLTRTTIVANVEGRTIPPTSPRPARVIFDGWLKADPDSRGEDVHMPPVLSGDALALSHQRGRTRHATAISLHRSGACEELEKRGIGRPSTYASIIKTIEDRGYVTKEGRTLFPTDTGDVVSSFWKTILRNTSATHSPRKWKLNWMILPRVSANMRQLCMHSILRFQRNFQRQLGKIANLGKCPELKYPKCKGPMVKLN